VEITFIQNGKLDKFPRPEWRCLRLARALQHTGRHTSHVIDLNEFLQNRSGASELCSTSDMLVLQANFLQASLESVHRWKAAGKTVLVDIDRNLAEDVLAMDLIDTEPGGAYAIPPKPSGHTRTRSRPTPAATAYFHQLVHLADAITVPNAAALEHWHSHKRAHLLPDALELDRYLNISPVSHAGAVIGLMDCGWSIQMLAERGGIEAFQRLCNARPQIKFLLWGGVPELLRDLPIPTENKLLQPAFTERDWPRHLSYVDIGLLYLDKRAARLPDTTLLLEYMAMKIPWLASDCPDAMPLRQYGWLVKNDINAWGRVLIDMIDHLKAYRAEAARDAYLYALSRGIEENIEPVLALYQSILQQNNKKTGYLKPPAILNPCGRF